MSKHVMTQARVTQILQRAWQQEKGARPPIPVRKTTSTGKPLEKGQIIAGPRDFCPEG